MRIRFWIVVIGISIGVIGAGVWLSTSLLFLRAITPNDSQAVVLGSKAGTPLDPIVRQIVTAYLPSQAQEAVFGFSRWLYRRTDTGADSLAAVTGIGGNLPPSAPGWESKKLGWITIQSEDGGKQSMQTTIINALGFVVQAALGQTAFVQPTLHVEFPSEPGPLFASGQLKDSVFSFVYSRLSINQLPKPVNTRNYENIDRLEVSLPSQFISNIPDVTQGIIEDRIVAELGLTKTKPDVLSELTQGTAIGMLDMRVGANSSSQFAVGVYGGNLATAVTDWVAKERGYLNPVQRAFRLPDGSLGYELVPADDTTADFGGVDEHGCQQSVISAGDVWLCQQGAAAAFGRDRATTQRLVTTLVHEQEVSNSNNNELPWHVLLPGNYIDTIPASLSISQPVNFSGIYIEGVANQGRGYLIVK